MLPPGNVTRLKVLLFCLISFSYEELEQMQNYTGSVVKYEAYTHQPAGEDFFYNYLPLLFYSCYFACHFSLYLFSFSLLLHPPNSAKPEGSNPADKRKALYQKFYKLVQEERKPADCVIISITNQCL